MTPIVGIIMDNILPMPYAMRQKTYPGFAILRGDKHLQVLQMIYMSGFVDYLQGKTAN